MKPSGLSRSVESTGAGKNSDNHRSRRSQSIRISQAMTACDNWPPIYSQAESQLGFLHLLIRVIIS